MSLLLPLMAIMITQVFDNVLIQPRDAREASDVFYRQRLGDVLLTYENEVVLTNEVGAVACFVFGGYRGGVACLDVATAAEDTYTWLRGMCTLCWLPYRQCLCSSYPLPVGGSRTWWLVTLPSPVASVRARQGSALCGSQSECPH